MAGPTSLDWPNCLNVRDLGGLPASNGRRIRTGALIRSDNLSRLTEEGVAAVRAARVSRIVDVRSPAECESDPSPFRADPMYRNLPLYRETDTFDATLTLAQDYMVMLDHNPDLLAAAVGAIADAPTGGVVVHCHAGKDRSGNVVALALGLVGVPAEAIAADYAAIDDRMAEHFAGQLDLVVDRTERAQLDESFSARPETMLALIAHVHDRYGGAEPYLRYGGLTVRQVERLRSRLIA
ncbi:MAG TPA: tyrosine-protein phosphatase [Candidatus Limnocylindria bacterium]|nr:tyrosine-protein phosphatase [Candidatus Limnocylindria bacterium]